MSFESISNSQNSDGAQEAYPSSVSGNDNPGENFGDLISDGVNAIGDALGGISEKPAESEETNEQLPEDDFGNAFWEEEPATDSDAQVSGNASKEETVSDLDGQVSGNASEVRDEPRNLPMEQGGSSFLFLILAAVILLAAAVFAVLKFLGKKQVSDVGSMPMKLTVLKGKTRAKQDTVYFREGFTVGSDPKCDLCLVGGYIEPIHAKLTLVNGTMYIEDNRSGVGVTIGGMRIQERNPLRSGDIIGIGDVVFSLQF